MGPHQSPLSSLTPSVCGCSLHAHTHKTINPAEMRAIKREVSESHLDFLILPKMHNNAAKTLALYGVAALLLRGYIGQSIILRTNWHTDC